MLKRRAPSTSAHRARVVGVLLAGLMLLDPIVMASFTSAPNGPNSVTIAQFAAPTSVSAVRGTCQTLASVAVNIT